jgi:hypothetical protein
MNRVRGAGVHQRGMDGARAKIEKAASFLAAF